MIINSFQNLLLCVTKADTIHDAQYHLEICVFSENYFTVKYVENLYNRVTDEPVLMITVFWYTVPCNSHNTSTP